MYPSASHSWRRIVSSAIVAVLMPVLAVGTQAQVEAAVANLEWREIGPTIMGGRVADLAVVESDPAVFYVGTATGGLWKTVNHGTSFESVFDDHPTSSIGDVTLAPSNPNIVWVGTGEPQNRQSSPWGNGVYKSTDAGRTWSHMGLDATHHIARIAIHPMNPDIVFVAAVGHLWGSNPERGVFRTLDGGATWEKVLYVDEHTGAIDLVMDPGDPQTLFAAMYQRQRTGWGFNGGGPGSGIYRTTDGGATWIELQEGLPRGDKGRIGLGIYRRDGNLVYAIVEADPRRPGQGFGAGQGQAGRRQNGVYRSTDRGDTWEHLSETNNRPMYYSQIWIDPSDPERIYLGGAQMYRSSDGGKTFTNDAARGVHSDHHALWIDPNNSDRLILAGDGGVSISWDRSDSWRQLQNLPLAQFYEIGVDMRDPYYVCGGLQDNGSWCGPSATLSSQGIRAKDWYNIGSGDGFYTVIDPTDHTMIFVESQGGNIARMNLKTMERTRMRPVLRSMGEEEEEEEEGEGESRNYRWNWNTPIEMSVHDRAVIYTGSNVVLKSTDRGMSWTEISHDLTKAIDRDELEIMGVRGSRPMMSRNDGISTYGNITTISESPVDADLLYVGTDDGNVQRTRDGGASWTDLTGRFRGLPERTYVSSVVASRHAPGTVYATFDGHRNDDFAAYVYVSEDFGERWRQITEGLPVTSVNRIAEHPRTAGLLFVGNEMGAYFSVDRGARWARLKNNMPTVPVDDIVVHPRENDLVLGTHGRGIWIMDDITPLEQLSNRVLASSAHLFPVRRATSFNLYTPQGWTPGVWEAPDPPQGARIRYYLGRDLEAVPPVATDDNGETSGGPRASVRRMRRAGDSTGMARLTILDGNGDVVRELEGPGKAGIHEVIWDLRLPPPYEQETPQGGGGGGFGRFTPRGPRVLPGVYAARLDAAGQSLSTEIEVRLDPRAEISQADLMARQDAMMSAYKLAKPVYEAGQAVRRLTSQLSDVDALLKESDDAPGSLKQTVDSVRTQVRELGREINRVSGGARGTFSIEASTTRPTADQLWALERAWDEVPGLITALNAVITDTMPMIYDQLDEHGIRPDPGKAITVPER